MRHLRILTAAAMLLCAPLAIGVTQAAGTLRIGIQEDPERLDPAFGGTFGGRLVFAGLCDKLLDLRPDLSFAPQLATAWAWSADGLALTLTLRNGVNFQDGEPMTAAAVAFNLERYRTMPDSSRRGELRSVTGVEVVDPHTVRIKLSAPNVPLIAVLSDRAGMMVSPKAIERLGKDFFTAPVCSGPFRFVERTVLDRIVMDRFAGYWNTPPIHFDRVIVRPIPNSTVRLVNLQGGQLDMLQDLGPSDAGKVRADPKLRLTTSPALAFAAIGFNLANGKRAESPIARDRRVRAAFEAALDRRVINQVAMDGLFVPNNQTEGPASPFHAKSVPLPPHDVARARALLKEAGVERPVVELMVQNVPRDIQVAEMVQSMAAEAGFDVKVAVGESNANIEAMNRGEYNASLLNWSGRADPDTNISIFLSCDSSSNWGKYCPANFNDALAKGRAETDPARRAAQYSQVVSIYTQDRPMLVLYNVTWLFAHVAGIKGFVPVPDGLIRFQGLSLD